MWACANFRTMRFCRWATRQWRSHQDTHKTFPSKFFFTFTCKWFLCFYFWAVIWSYIVDLFAAFHELASASSRTLLKLASSVRALLKPYGDTLKHNIRWINGLSAHFLICISQICNQSYEFKQFLVRWHGFLLVEMKLWTLSFFVLFCFVLFSFFVNTIIMFK